MEESRSDQDIAAQTERELEADAADQARRYSKHELIGQGAQKKVYKAFDEEEGIEVAWNEVAVGELAWRTEKERSKLFAEIRVLKQLKHKNIMTLKHWWFDPKCKCICFITELFTDGTLRQYRRKHKNVDTSVIKRWAWQILQGLVYLHGHNPPIIHRDLKSDNIFVNGSSGVVKIGDLGFATMRAGLSTAMSVIGTPEFMAPELYEEQYNEKVDVYSFGLCLLELVTLEYPYAECRNPAQIFKKVTGGIHPAGLDKVTDEELRTFISTCITHDPTQRPEARQLLKHPFFDCVRSAGGAGGGLMKSAASVGHSLGSAMVVSASEPTSQPAATPLASPHPSVIDPATTAAAVNIVSATADAAALAASQNVTATMHVHVPQHLAASSAPDSGQGTPKSHPVEVGDSTLAAEADLNEEDVLFGGKSLEFPQSPPWNETPVSESAAEVSVELNRSEGGGGGPGTVGIDIVNQQQRLRLNCRNNKQDEAMLSFSMSFVNHNGARKKVGFLYNLDEDEPHDIANEMVENLSLNIEEADFIASMIQREVEQMKSNGYRHPPEGSGLVSRLMAQAKEQQQEQQQQQQQQQQHALEQQQQGLEQQQRQQQQSDDITASISGLTVSDPAQPKILSGGIYEALHQQSAEGVAAVQEPPEPELAEDESFQEEPDSSCFF